MAVYRNILPLGRITTTLGTPAPLSANCGPLQGTAILSGTALRQLQLTAPSSNTDIIYLLPRGKTLTANPEAIMAALLPGTVQQFPDGILLSSGVLPEDFVLDSPTTGQVMFGCGFFG